MPVYIRSKYRITLGVEMVAGDLNAEDRQCAWELYCELVSRTALIGREDADGKQMLDGDVMIESLESLQEFVSEARALMRRYPVGALNADAHPHHLGFYIASLLEIVFRPFLDKWHCPYRYWWGRACAGELGAGKPPCSRQKDFPGYEQLQSDWRELHMFCRSVVRELIAVFGLPDVLALEPPGLKGDWVKEIRDVNREAQLWKWQ